MIKITNRSSTHHVFATAAGTVEVLPGDARLVDVDPDSPAVKAKVAAGLILVGDPDDATEKGEPIGAAAVAGEDAGKADSRRGRRGAPAGGAAGSEGGATE
ncbi:hypothetical protein [Antarcticirhabdus aurantiaca]|uniref:Uncharacterized protein n=1 Tax=Antarcticirhabdus aurantiaca TaxID=2606717 RepID=A0ACD4NRK9_9HYPH|nr:hypothetical protein OXU80_03575 [Jeongeuplla avenae]